MEEDRGSREKSEVRKDKRGGEISRRNTPQRGVGCGEWRKREKRK